MRSERQAQPRAGRLFLATLAVSATMVASLAAQARADTPGTGGPARVVHFGSILPFVNETGFITLSENAVGTNDPAGGTLTVNKPTGATVRKAYMAAATTGFSGATLANGDVKIDGAGVTWDVSTPNAIFSTNYWSDVTSLVKPKLDGAAAGPVSFHVDEADTLNTEGEILAVIFNDPNQTVSNTIALLFGAQNVAGDTFGIGLAEPIDKSDPNLRLDMALGISFGFQPSNQFSTVDVNQNRMTSAAGGQDDGADENGELITVGGEGDSNANPADPNAGPDGPRSDDELYSLLPFVANGDTAIDVFTQNPSNDDNVFFAALVLNSTTAVVGEGITLAPLDSTNPVNTNHTLTATVQDSNGDPVASRSVTFTVISGPNSGKTGTGTTGTDGKATFTYSSSVAGVDEIRASFKNNADQTVLSNVARKEWTTSEVAHKTTTTYTGGASGQYSDPVSLSGRLVDDDAGSIGVPGKQLGFTLGTQTASAGPTDSGGNATTSLTITQKPGSVTKVDTSFLGDSTYLPSSDSDAFSILKEDCTLSYSGDILVPALANTKLAANLGEPDASLGDRSGKLVTFTVTDSGANVQTFTATTDASGHAETSQPLAADVYTVKASFAGDDFYNPCQTPGPDSILTVATAAAKVTGGGWLSTQSRTNFGFNLIPQAGGSFKTQFQLVARNNKSRFHARVVSAVTTPTTKSASWSGTGTWRDQTACSYQITVVDKGSPGKKGDTIDISITCASTVVYSTGGPQRLKGGNITVH